MLLNDFYILKKIQKEDDSNYTAAIHLNAEHAIFKGHFPGNPVTPGVCMIQITKEIASKILAKSLVLKTAKNVKFMEIINPNKTPELDLKLQFEKISDTEIKIKNNTHVGAKIGIKMNLIYTVK